MASEREDQVVGHDEHRVFEENANKWVSACSCGAVWTHQAKTPHAEMDSTFKSHVKYFENKTLVL